MSDNPLLASWLSGCLLWYFPLAGALIWLGFPGRKGRLSAAGILIAGPWLFVNLAFLAERPDNGLASIIALFGGFLYALPGLLLFAALLGIGALTRRIGPRCAAFPVKHRRFLLATLTLVLIVPAVQTMTCAAPEGFLRKRAQKFVEHGSPLDRPLVRLELGELTPAARDWMGSPTEFELPAVMRRQGEPEKRIRIYLNKHGSIYGYDNLY